MGFRFFRRVRIAPGITLNLSKSGGSISVGPRGAKLTVGSRGVRGTVGLPGTGLFYTTKLSSSRKDKHISVPTVDTTNNLTLGFFEKLLTPKEDQAFINGCREMVNENYDKSIEHLETASHVCDAKFLIGAIEFKRGNLKQAAQIFEEILGNSNDLGKKFNKYRIAPSISFPITDEISIRLEATVRDVFLALVEIYQIQKEYSKALGILHKMIEISPNDLVIKISLVELLLDFDKNNKGFNEDIIKITENITNENELETILLYYKAKALKNLGLLTASRDTLTKALRRKKGRSKELLLNVRYERAFIYKKLGSKSRYRGELEKIYLEDYDFKDVKILLNL